MRADVVRRHNPKHESRERETSKRLTWVATGLFCHINGWHVDAPDDATNDFVIAFADGTLTELEIIADTLERRSRAPDTEM